MFSIVYDKDKNLIALGGNFDSSKSEEAKDVFMRVNSSVTVDMTNLDFICSSGVGTLVMVYTQLKQSGESMTLVNLKPHIKKVFEVSMLHRVFDIK